MSLINNKMDYDIAIIGSGLAGSIQAMLLAEHGFNIILLDLYPEAESKYLDKNNNLNNNIKPDLRMSAITLKSEEILIKLGIWDQVKHRSGLMQKTHVWEDNGPGELSFDSLAIGKNYLSTIVENNFLLEIINNKIKTITNIKIVRPCNINNIIYKNNYSEIITNNNRFSVNLVIGADGANSWVRNYYKYDCIIESYNHSALVTNVYTEKPHNNIAYQCFLKDGPLAFLPWADPNCCSIVWSQGIDNAKYRQQCPENIFNNELEQNINSKLGKIISTSKRVSFPLVMRHAEQYYKQGSVLIGDAAHTIHPLAGQGLNLGIYDAYELANILLWAKQKQYKINSDLVLKKYQLKRRGHNQQMISLMGIFKELYSLDSKAINLFRNLGANLFNDFSFAKKQVSSYAAGFY